MFLEKRMTDYMPIILPTEERVADICDSDSGEGPPRGF
jgi:hypothetical protein